MSGKPQTALTFRGGLSASALTLSSPFLTIHKELSYAVRRNSVFKHLRFPPGCLAYLSRNNSLVAFGEKPVRKQKEPGYPQALSGEFFFSVLAECLSPVTRVLLKLLRL